MYSAKPYTQYIFLLGGHDFEMQEIWQILVEMKLIHFDYRFELSAKSINYPPVLIKKNFCLEKKNQIKLLDSICIKDKTIYKSFKKNLNHEQSENCRIN